LQAKRPDRINDAVRSRGTAKADTLCAGMGQTFYGAFDQQFTLKNQGQVLT